MAREAAPLRTSLENIMGGYDRREIYCVNMRARTAYAKNRTEIGTNVYHFLANI